MPHDLPPLLVFADDWGRHPSSCQHLVRHMLPHRRVLWVNTIGTRRPRLSLHDFRRGFEKLRQWSRATPPQADIDSRPGEPIVINPIMWPDFASLLARAINTPLLARAVSNAITDHLGEPPVVLTTVPLMAPLVGRFPARGWIYYCVDDWSTWPGLDHDTLAAMETDLLGSVDAVAAVSEPLVDRIAATGRNPKLITHGVDTAAWSTPDPDFAADPILAQLQNIPGKLAVFWGLIDNKIDTAALHNLAQNWKGTIALIGPEGDEAASVLRIPGVKHLGPAAHGVLPHVADLADVLIMPYVSDHPALIASQPLKLMEYLATDRPVVCLDLPAARRWSDCCDVVSAEDFAQRVIERASRAAPPGQIIARQRRLPAESWQAKSAELAELLDTVQQHELISGRRAS